jgi:hypothetical protein
MYKVYKQTGKQEAILVLCIITAGIKLLDLFMPVRIDKVINPAVSIILEGLAVIVVIQVMKKSQELFKPRLLNLAAVSFSWRIFYTLYALFLPNSMLIVSPVRELIPYLKFLLLEGVVNFITIFIILRFWEKAKNVILLILNSVIAEKLEKAKQMGLKPKLLLSIVMLIAAVSLQLTY